MYYSRHDTGLDTSTRLPRERTAYPPAGFNPSPQPTLLYPSNPSVPHSVGVFLSFSRVRQLLSPSLGNCYRTIQPRMQIAALSRVSRMTFDEIRFRGKEKETRMSLSSSLSPSAPYFCFGFSSYFSFRIPSSGGTTKNPLLAVTSQSIRWDTIVPPVRNTKIVRNL